MRIKPICSASHKKSGRIATVYEPYWSPDNRFPVIFQDTARAVYVASSDDLEPQHIIDRELAIKYGLIEDTNETI